MFNPEESKSEQNAKQDFDRIAAEWITKVKEMEQAALGDAENLSVLKEEQRAIEDTLVRTALRYRDSCSEDSEWCREIKDVTRDLHNGEDLNSEGMRARLQFKKWIIQTYSEEGRAAA